MKRHAITLAFAILTSAQIAAAAQTTVDQLLTDHGRLDAELGRCKRLGMAEINDARCKVAHEAEHKRFFGGGTHYTPSEAPNIFPSNPGIDPQPMKQKASPKRDAGQHGQ